jgi:hypothetical protein
MLVQRPFLLGLLLEVSARGSARTLMSVVRCIVLRSSILATRHTVSPSMQIVARLMVLGAWRRRVRVPDYLRSQGNGLVHQLLKIIDRPLKY